MDIRAPQYRQRPFNISQLITGIKSKTDSRFPQAVQ
jgi:hypothetical protein